MLDHALASPNPHETLLDRMVSAVEIVRDRLRRVTAALAAGGVDYVVAEGNAVGYWVATREKEAVRTTRDVDVILRAEDLERASAAVAPYGFVYRHAAGIHMFLDGPSGSARDAVHILLADQKVRPDYVASIPSVKESVPSDEGHMVVSLPALVRMKLTSFRDKDRMHLRDLIDVGLLGPEHVAEFPGVLGERLQFLFDNPE